MRYVLLDIETTGLQRSEGHRILEIAMLEIIDNQLTGKQFHSLINPQRDIPDSVVKIHGITNNHVKDSPAFKDIIDDIKEFISNSTIIAHNAQFDMKFLRHEFDLCLYDFPENQVICTRDLARRKLKITKYTLDALCDYFQVNRAMREIHGAMLDCKLLAEIYLNLIQL